VHVRNVSTTCVADLVTLKPVRPGYTARLNDDSEQPTGVSVMLKCIQIWYIYSVYSTYLHWGIFQRLGSHCGKRYGEGYLLPTLLGDLGERRKLPQIWSLLTLKYGAWS